MAAGNREYEILGVELGLGLTDFIAKGDCGDNLIWTLYTDGELAIDVTESVKIVQENSKLASNYDEDYEISYGIGDMYNFKEGNAPWYEWRYDIKNVSVERYVTYLGNYAFYNCPNLTEINFKSDWVTEIGYDCFKNCSSLTEITIPYRVAIIGSSAFEGCTSLEKVSLPENLTKLYPYIFTNCKSLNEIELNDNISSLDSGSFTNCSSLESLNIPKSVSEIGQKAFYGCNSLSNIYYDGSKEEWNNIDIHSSNNSVLNSCNIHYNGEYSDDDDYDYNDNYIYKLTLTSQKSGHEAKITITSEPEGATIYYTLDGEDPTEDSEIYTEPFYLYDDTLIRVWATYKGSESDIMDFQLTFDEDDDDGDVYIECPYCEELFLENEDMYDEYGDVYCPYCDEYIFSRDDDDNEYDDDDEYYDGFETTSFDSTVSDWALEEIEEAYENDLIPKTLIGRDLTYTVGRAEFAAIAVQLYETLTGESAESKYTPFDDIDDCNNEEEIEKAYGLGIVNGITYDTFEPYMDITREQLATMLCRTIKKYSFEDWTLEDDDNYYLDTSGVAKFEDDNEISDYAKPSVYYMAKFGIIKGVDETHFAPKNSTEWQEAVGYATATREQALIMALRIFNVSEMWQ